jgi:hypothetical protein
MMAHTHKGSVNEKHRETCPNQLPATDKDYLEARAEEELELARKATDPDAVSAHYELACRYLDLLHPETSETGTKPKDKKSSGN